MNKNLFYGNFFVEMVKANLETFKGVVFCVGVGRVLCSSNKHLSFHHYLLSSLISPLHF